MAAHIGQPTRSRRFIKAYLMTWGLLAVGALAYLALLAFPPPTAVPSPEVSLYAPETSAPETSAPGTSAPGTSAPGTSAPGTSAPGTSAPEAPKALAEVQALEENLSEVRKDVAELQDAMGDRVANETGVQSRLTALEERVATIDPPPPPPAVPAAPEPKRPDKTAHKVPAPHTTADILARTADAKPRNVKAEGVPPPPATPEVDAPPAAPIETGSITPKAEVIFGEAIVKPAARTDFAVQLAAGRSPQTLRQSWLELVKRHGSPLASLEPRIASPGTGGEIYRLLAGPVPTKADAQQICAQMGVGPNACFATRYGGAPL